MIVRRVQLAIIRALTGYRVDGFSPLHEALAHMEVDGTYPSSWVPDMAPDLSGIRIFPEKPIDNLKVYPFVCINSAFHPVAEHTQDVTVYDSNGMNPESYPGLTCWKGEWNVYAEDNEDASFRTERIREIIDASMEYAISNNNLDFSLPEESMNPIPQSFKPVPPGVELILFRRIGLTQPYDEWYDGRRYWWRGITYCVELQEKDPIHSSLRR